MNWSTRVRPSVSAKSQGHAHVQHLQVAKLQQACWLCEGERRRLTVRQAARHALEDVARGLLEIRGRDLGHLVRQSQHHRHGVMVLFAQHRHSKEVLPRAHGRDLRLDGFQVHAVARLGVQPLLREHETGGEPGCGQIQ
jgi:hypothetical protein